jgi:hypothetical protein
MSLTIPFRVFGKFHYTKLDNDLITVNSHKCPYFNDAFSDKKYPELLSNTPVNYCSKCFECNNNEYSHIVLSLCGLGKEDIIDNYIEYEKQIETANNMNLDDWKSLLFICPNCSNLYYTNNIYELLKDIQYTTKLNEIEISYPYNSYEKYISFDINNLVDLRIKFKDELKSFYEKEINDYLSYILINVLQFNHALNKMYEQMKTTNLNKITFSLSFIWFTKPFYTAECSYIPPLNKEDYHNLYDKHLFSFIKDTLPELTNLKVEYPNLDDNSVKNINIINDTKLGVDFTLQF